MDNKLIKNITRQLQDVQDQENWLDENFKKKIDDIPEEQAFKRPFPELHSVAELVSHLLEWRKESIRKLKGEAAKLTMDSPENWRTNDELKKVGWDKLKSDFYESQLELIRLIENQPDEYLEKEYQDGYKFKYLIEGLIHHDLYHLGQLGITIKFLNLKQ
ncbi:DinB family protein [Negadavirga shengliensis]|uniref:DinB family protein n=1 Tax=Negadavirga shengliensis TaxID=1389218 RepID=A0ABV9T8K2_9BACT